MPRNVRRFAWLYSASFLVTLLGIPPTYIAAWTQREAGKELQVIAVAILIYVLLALPFFWLTVWQRKNWARWLLLIVFVVSVPFSFPSSPLIHFHAAYIAVALLGILLEAMAFYFLFTGDARPWFRP